MPAWALALGALAAIAAILALLAALGSESLPDRSGPPIEELAVERTELSPNRIDLTLRNTGPDPVEIGQVFVNDAFVDFTAGERRVGRLDATTLSLVYPWQEGQPYAISLVTSTGAVIESEIAAAAETPRADAGFFGLMTLLGTYVGIVPVLLGMLLLPALRRSGERWIRVVMALTVGLLGFLALDGTLEGLELAGRSGGAFGGVEVVFVGAAVAFLGLMGLDRYLTRRRGDAAAAGATANRLALMVAIGIGLHNLGEGLAIGSAYAVGELALGAFLVVGFAIHNTTEGVAIVAPLARERPSFAGLAGLGLIAGAPAIAGAVIGASVTSPELSALLLGVGVGAIAQVIVQIAPSVRDAAGRLLDAATATAMAAGALALYATGLLVSV
ncbi:MAG: ZIP family metal transporter [Solirubrobacterales bacterium]|nr:ZIP family metal transporter [Solirubrobacterales bacterium]